MKKIRWKCAAAVCLTLVFTVGGSCLEVHSAGSKAAEGKAAESKTTGSRTAEGKTQESKTLESKTAGSNAVESKVTEERIDAYFDDSVFVGDSIMLGFRNYAMKKEDTFLKKMKFLAAGSFSANNALWPVDDKSVHPMYQGTQRQIWESISLMRGKRVFLMFGMNDLNVYGLEGTCDAYKELIGKIEEKNPGTEFYIMSMTYVLKGKDKGLLENDTIREFNAMLKQMAKENDWGYVEIADAIADENGDLGEEYCSDEFAHQKPEAYDVWVEVLRKYAQERLDDKRRWRDGE